MKKTILSGFIQNIKFGIQTCYAASKKYFLLKCMLLVGFLISSFVSIWIWKEILNKLSSIDTKKDIYIIAILLIVYIVLVLGNHIGNSLSEYINKRYGEELIFYIEKNMIEKTSRMDLSYFDSSSIGDKIKYVRDNLDVMSDLTWLVFDLFAEAANIVLALVIVCAYNWFIGLITLLLIVPSIFYNRKYVYKKINIEKEQLRDKRKISYYKDIFHKNNAQFEIQANNIGRFFLDKYENTWKELYRQNINEYSKFTIVNLLLTSISLIGDALIIISTIYDSITSKYYIGNLQYNISMVARLRNQSVNLINDINRFLSYGERLSDINDFLNISPEKEKCGSLIPSSNPQIEFRNVCFKYPNCDQYVLNNCCFTINPHEKIGLVGLNGAGKSTIIKLIFRFYDPESGEILVDGINIKKYNVYAIRKIFGVMFQDYVPYCLPIREVIALSSFKERFNEEKLNRVCDLSGLLEVVKYWSNGYDSILGRYYADNGKDLSGGQWQLVGLSRAYFRDSEYIIFDEPSSSLDPYSENRIFEQLYGLSNNNNSIIISHRLSNVNIADKILVLGEGKIIESGNHYNLIERNGVYARLYNTQAQKYK